MTKPNKPIISSSVQETTAESDAAPEPNCMEDNWFAAKGDHGGGLSCEAKEVYLDYIDSESLTTKCVEGQDVKLDLSASVFFHTARYDVGWYIATDGGDALHGQCNVTILENNNKGDYMPIMAEHGSKVPVGQVQWDNDFKKGNDECGDVFFNSGGGGVLDFMNLGTDLTLKCKDTNKDGIMDFGICFSWRQQGGDDVCIPHLLYPGSPAKCFCTEYNIPKIQMVTPIIEVDSTVYLGIDDGGSCNTDAAVDYVASNNGDAVTYCFEVKNMGNSFLNSVEIFAQELSFTDTSIGLLAPGASVTVHYSTTIDGARTTNVIVTAMPVLEDGKVIPSAAAVSASDSSSVGYGVKGDLQPNSCLQDSWDDAGKDGKLSSKLLCTTKEVFLESITTSEPMSCTLGEMVTVTLSASIHLDSSRYDLGWYVAADDGDALEGTCIVKGLQKGYEYNVVASSGSTTEAGTVSWGEDFAGGSDSCGDVFIGGDGGGNIEIPFLVDTQIHCTDDNEDGQMDLHVCFTWRSEETDDFCTLEDLDPSTLGNLADLYPGNTSMCYCSSYDVPTIAVIRMSAEGMVAC